MRRPLTAMFFTMAALAPAAARAEGEPHRAPPSGMRAEMRDYYGGELGTAYMFTAIGLGSAGVGAVLWTRGGDFRTGLGASFVVVGGLQAIGASLYALQVGRELDHYDALLARDPAGYRREEGAHIGGTVSRFVVYRAVELGLALAGAGVAAYGFASDADLWKGIGIGVCAQALTFFVLDAFGQGRAREYARKVERFVPTLEISGAGRARYGGISLSTTF